MEQILLVFLFLPVFPPTRERSVKANPFLDLPWYLKATKNWFVCPLCKSWQHQTNTHMGQGGYVAIFRTNKVMADTVV